MSANSSQEKSEVHETPYHPPLGPLALGHLPSIPPRPRELIEITETFTDHSTTDTEGDYSSWGSESVSEGGNVQTKSQPGPSRTNQKGIDSFKSERKAVATSCNNNRIRDPGEFAPDADLEAQRQKALFQKLPERSSSNVGQEVVYRNCSGLAGSKLVFPRTAFGNDRCDEENVRRRARGGCSQRVKSQNVSEMVNSQRSNTPQRSGYRPRVKPADQIQDEDSEYEDSEDVIQVSRSISERRLAGLVGARARASPAQVGTERADTAPSAQPIARMATMPVTIHPSLPEPAPVQTPHTIVRNNISKELDEEVVRFLGKSSSQSYSDGKH
ncbi:hypothetical protein BU17DRAFT_96974 [Hysterangium stoloniferum]|nr:hypothetical protein BU17DRAFT_96974 [Hysterangium stoloniferum]